MPGTSFKYITFWYVRRDCVWCDECDSHSALITMRNHHLVCFIAFYLMTFEHDVGVKNALCQQIDRHRETFHCCRKHAICYLTPNHTQSLGWDTSFAFIFLFFLVFFCCRFIQLWSLHIYATFLEATHIHFKYRPCKLLFGNWMLKKQQASYS